MLLIAFASYREGFSNEVMKALAMGLLSIVTDINGCKEINENNVNRKVIKLKSVSKIYVAMLEMYTDKKLYNLIGEKTIDVIKQRYERKLFWDILLGEYNSLLNKNEK